MPPAPKHPSERRRRNATVPMNQLPAGGRPGRAPKWPLAECSTEERRLWGELWKLPQAVVWERQHLFRLVARYCRRLLEAEEPGAGASLCGEVVKLEDRLLLNPDRLKRAHYEIVEGESASVTPLGQPSRSRLRVADPAAS